MITKVTSKQFNQDVSKIKKANVFEPVFITNKGGFAHVAQTMSDDKIFTQPEPSVADLLSMPEVADIEFEIPKIQGQFYKLEDLG